MPPTCPVVFHPYPPTAAEHAAHFGLCLATREKDPQDTHFQQLLRKQEKDNETTPQTSAPVPWKARAHIHVGQAQVFTEQLFCFLVSLSFVV